MPETFRGILYGVSELPGYERFPVDGNLVDEMIDGLEEFADVLERGEPVEDHFRVTVRDQRMLGLTDEVDWFRRTCDQ